MDGSDEKKQDQSQDQEQQGGQQTDQQSNDGGAQQKSQTPATQAKGVALKLTQEQIDRLLKDGTLELGDEHFTGAVKERMAALTARAKAAERKLAEIAAAQEEAERKALEEQERYKELYEKERAEREKERQARTEEAIRSRFLLAATKVGVVDPEAAYLLAKSLDAWKQVQVGEEGQVAGIDEAVKALIEAKPYLVSQQEQKKQSVGSASNPAPSATPAPKNISEAGDELERRLRAGV